MNVVTSHSHVGDVMLAGKPPSERIQFLLGMDDDEDHQTHDIFCEMGELRHEADEYEWKETARCVHACLPLRLRACVRAHTSPCHTFWRSKYERAVVWCSSVNILKCVIDTSRQHVDAHVVVDRWVKFEEVVEEGGDRWSKPHVATLSLHSLFELRKGMLSGTVMLDLEAFDIQGVAGESLSRRLTFSMSYRVSKLQISHCS